MANGQTLFDLPNVPEEFGVLLAPADLRRIVFSALDFPSARRAIIEYIRTYFPNEFNDFVASNGVIMLTEIQAAETAKLALRSDILINEAFLPLARTEAAVVNHLALINQRIRRQTPAVVDVELTVDNPVSTDIIIIPGTTLTTNGPDNEPIIYEIFRSPGDFNSKIVIPASKRGIIAFGLEGSFVGPVTFTSVSGPNQKFEIVDENMLESPILVTITTGEMVEDWQIILDPIEKFGPNDKVVEITFIGRTTTLQFGNNINGKALLPGQIVSVRYRVGGGIRGRIGVGQLDESREINPEPPANAAVTIRLRNITSSSGGTDKESLEVAKRRAPRDFAVNKSIVTADDYAQVTNTFQHPVFGSVAKAVATLRTSINANRVEIYCLALGAEGRLETPNAGLKRGLTTFLTDLNVLTDHVIILDGFLRPVDVDMTVVVGKNADATIVKDRVEKALDDFFDPDNWEMGQPLFISNLIEVVERIDGVSYVDLFSPSDNILSSQDTGSVGTASTGIAFNEIIVLGQRKTRYFYDKGRI